ncbi:MAG TPA: hypothetical protein IAB45_03425 [Candidatus Onthousia faecavium]|nr:hypothetical protein [Candidatus Onthousia faecavium]
MKVFRFMSKKEYEKLIKGEKLVNRARHIAHTTSIGFCFMDLKDNPPEVAFHYLIGLVCPEVCVIFNVKNKNVLSKGYGRYTDINSENFFARCIREEYYTTQYSREDLEPIMVSKKIDLNLNDFGYIFNWNEVENVKD